MNNSETEISAGFPFEIQEIDISDYFTEENLKFDAKDNPDEIFTSDDNATTISFGDCELAIVWGIEAEALLDNTNFSFA